MSVNTPGQMENEVLLQVVMKSIKSVGILTMSTLFKATRPAQSKVKDMCMK